MFEQVAAREIGHNTKLIKHFLVFKRDIQHELIKRTRLSDAGLWDILGFGLVKSHHLRLQKDVCTRFGRATVWKLLMVGCRMSAVFQTRIGTLHWIPSLMQSGASRLDPIVLCLQHQQISWSWLQAQICLQGHQKLHHTARDSSLLEKMPSQCPQLRGVWNSSGLSVPSSSWMSWCGSRAKPLNGLSCAGFWHIWFRGVACFSEFHLAT